MNKTALRKGSRGKIMEELAKQKDMIYEDNCL